MAEGKTAGLIVDYVGIFRNLQDALRIYAQPRLQGQMPIHDKAALVEQLEGLLKEADGFCKARGIDLQGILATPPAGRLAALQGALEVIVGIEDDRKAYLLLSGQVARTFKAILPDARANAHAPLSVLVAYLGAMIKALNPPPDIAGIMADVEQLLNDSIATEGYRIGQAPKAEALIDLSQIDFEQLQLKFEQGKQKATETEKLKGQIQQKLQKMVRENKGRTDFLEKFQKMIEDYNASSHNLEAFFKELVAFAEGLNEEERRAAREGLTQEEQAIFDLLTRPEPELSEKEREEVKKVAKALLAKLKAEVLVDNWRVKMQARAAVESAIWSYCRKLPAPYTSELKRDKRIRTYAHVYENYFGPGHSVYEARTFH